MGWYFSIPFVGKTAPNDCCDCGALIGITFEGDFRTPRLKLNAKKAGNNWINGCYANVRKNCQRALFFTLETDMPQYAEGLPGKVKASDGERPGQHK